MPKEILKRLASHSTCNLSFPFHWLAVEHFGYSFQRILFTLYHFTWYFENEPTASIPMPLSPLPTLTGYDSYLSRELAGSDHVPVSQIVPHKHHPCLVLTNRHERIQNILFYSREDWRRKRWIFLVTQRESELDQWLILNPVLLTCAVFPYY